MKYIINPMQHIPLNAEHWHVNKHVQLVGRLMSAAAAAAVAELPAVAHFPGTIICCRLALPVAGVL